MARDQIVVDASVALKWAIDEEGTAAAVKLLDREVLHAPDFLLLEVANILWSKTRRQVISRAEADEAYEAIAAVPLTVTPLAELVAPARALAFALDLTAYDAVYAALAQRLACPLATADETLARAMGEAGLGASGLLVR